MQPHLINLPKVENATGNYTLIEGNAIPFEVKRVYYLYDIPVGAERGGHSHINQSEFLIAVSGSFDVILKDGFSEKTCTLDNPETGLFIGTGVWRELNNFTSNAVCLVVSSDLFDESDYIREYDHFLKAVK